jgi:hypothetical protein
MNTDDALFFLVGIIVFGFVAFWLGRVLWLLTYGNPKAAPQWTARLFQIMGFAMLVLLIANAGYQLFVK